MECLITGCCGVVKARNFCQKHYKRLLKFGDPLLGVERGKWVRKACPPRTHKIMENGCWEWQGSLRHGYGPHREAWEMFNNESAAGYVIRHTCDNPKCVNPLHLRAGTQYENLRDMFDKGRNVAPRGERNYWAKLTEHQIIEIRKDNRSQRKIARDYGVSGSHVCNIKRGLKWAHVSA